jgi:2-polyprenyl-3-methyl-5-hydroxy-6-metoxy-1,4-benzoquinol methylase
MPDAPCNCNSMNTFSAKEADADLERFRKEGPTPTTRALLEAIVAEGVAGATLLDIGAGIGAIQLELLAAGAASAQSVDATEAYVEIARIEAERRGYGDRTRGQLGDFVELAKDIAPADIVTLDKVVCCYADMPSLIRQVAEHAGRAVGMVYPREIWWNRIASRAFATLGWLTRDTTRWHVHRTSDIDSIMRDAGLTRREVRRDKIWQVVLYVRA